MNNWMNALFTITKKQNLFRQFGRRRNRGVLWASLFGLGISAIAFGFRKNKSLKAPDTLQRFMNNMRTRNNRMPNMANALLELSKDITPSNDTLTKK